MRPRKTTSWKLATNRPRRSAKTWWVKCNNVLIHILCCVRFGICFWNILFCLQFAERENWSQPEQVCVFLFSCFFCESVGVAGSDLGSGWIGWLAAPLHFSWRIKQNITENGCECYSRNIAVLHWCNRFQFNSAAAKYQTPLPPWKSVDPPLCRVSCHLQKPNFSCFV